MTCFAILSMKGGVGKSTVTLGLAGSCWERGASVLVIDIDPQANATAGLDVTSFGYSANDVLADARSGVAADAIVESPWGSNVHVLPSERALEHRNVPEIADSSLRLRVATEGVLDAYDVVLIDCPPSVGELTRNALAVADAAIIVTEPGYFAMRGAEQAREAVDVVRSATNLRLHTAGIVINRVRHNLTEHQFRITELSNTFGDLIFETQLPERSSIQQAQGAGIPIQAWRSPGARDVSDAFDDLLDEALKRTTPSIALKGNAG